MVVVDCMMMPVPVVTMVAMSLLMLATETSSAGNAAAGNDELVIETNSGSVRGVRQRAANGRKVDVWWGIPYAEPPIDDLRFRAPRPIKK